MTSVLAVDPWMFLIMTVGLFGAASWAMGRAIADTWRPVWQVVPYGLLLAAADRFLVFALGGAPLLSLTGYLAAAAAIIALALLGWRIAHVTRMVTQYPWVYERAGPFAYRERRAEPTPGG